MASRMDRYREPERQIRSRSANNQDLYKKIYDNAEYSNIEHVITTPNANEINIENIKKMLNELENERNRRQIVKRNVEEKKPIELPAKDERSYDIRDILKQARDERPPEQKKYRSLKNEEYNILNNIDIKEEPEQNNLNNDLQDLMNTLTNAKLINQLGDNELSLELLDDLRSNTMIGDSKSIRAIINEELEKERELAKTKEETANEKYYDLDNNFGFDSKDFDGKSSGSTKKGNKFLVVTTSFFATVAAIALIIWIFIQIMNS